MLRHLVPSSSLCGPSARVFHAAAAASSSPALAAGRSAVCATAAVPSVTQQQRRALHALPPTRAASAAVSASATPAAAVPPFTDAAAAAVSVPPSAASDSDGHANNGSRGNSGPSGGESAHDGSHGDGGRSGSAHGDAGQQSAGPEQPYVDPTHSWLDRLLSNSAVRKRVLTCAAIGVGLELSEQMASELPSIAAWQMAIAVLREPQGVGLEQARYATPSALWKGWKREQRRMLARQQQSRAESQRSWWQSDDSHEGWDPVRRPLVFDAAQMELERMPALQHLDIIERGDRLRERTDVQRAAVWEVLLRMGTFEQIRKKWGQRKVAEMKQQEQAQQQQLQQLLSEREGQPMQAQQQ